MKHRAAKTTSRSRKPQPRSRRRSARWETQRAALIAAAQRAIRKRGPRVSMDDIAAEAHVAKPILYRHFGDRGGLARALGESVLLLSSSGDKADVLRRMTAFYPQVDTPEDLLRVFQGFVGQFSTFVEMDTDLYCFLQTEQALQRMMQGSDGRRLRSPVAESLARSLSAIVEQRGLDRRPVDLWAHALVALAGGAVDWWAEHKPFHRFELERYVLDLAWSGLKGILERRPPRVAPTSRRARPAARLHKRQPHRR